MTSKTQVDERSKSSVALISGRDWHFLAIQFFFLLKIHFLIVKQYVLHPPPWANELFSLWISWISWTHVPGTTVLTCISYLGHPPISWNIEFFITNCSFHCNFTLLIPTIQSLIQTIIRDVSVCEKRKKKSWTIWNAWKDAFSMHLKFENVVLWRAQKSEIRLKPERSHPCIIRQHSWNKLNLSCLDRLTFFIKPLPILQFPPPTHTHTHKQRHTYTHTHTYTNTDTHTQTHTQTHTYKHRHAYTNTHTHTHTYSFEYINYIHCVQMMDRHQSNTHIYTLNITKHKKEFLLFGNEIAISSIMNDSFSWKRRERVKKRKWKGENWER